jgi:hypothetical protein
VPDTVLVEVFVWDFVLDIFLGGLDIFHQLLDIFFGDLDIFQCELDIYTLSGNCISCYVGFKRSKLIDA